MMLHKGTQQRDHRTSGIVAAQSIQPISLNSWGEWVARVTC